MGDEPAPVRAVTGEAPAQVVVNTPGAHRVQCAAEGVERGAVARAPRVLRQNFESCRLGELGSTTEAAPLRVVALEEGFGGAGHGTGSRQRLATALAPLGFFEGGAALRLP